MSRSEYTRPGSQTLPHKVLLHSPCTFHCYVIHYQTLWWRHAENRSRRVCQISSGITFTNNFVDPLVHCWYEQQLYPTVLFLGLDIYVPVRTMNSDVLGSLAKYFIVSAVLSKHSELCKISLFVSDITTTNTSRWINRGHLFSNGN